MANKKAEIRKAVQSYLRVKKSIDELRELMETIDADNRAVLREIITDYKDGQKRLNSYCKKVFGKSIDDLSGYVITKKDGEE